MSERQPQHPVDPMFPDRWSPRAFEERAVPREMLMILFEAARWAPSAMNEQPWRFVWADEEADLVRFRAALVEGNQIWANRVPVLIFLLARKSYLRNERPNKAAAFDTGAAWMALALQARKLGLYTHAMGGFDREKALAAVGADGEEYDVMAAIAVGWKGDAESLPDDLKAREAPGGRKGVDEFCFAGHLR